MSEEWIKEEIWLQLYTLLRKLSKLLEIDETEEDTKKTPYPQIQPFTFPMEEIERDIEEKPIKGDIWTSYVRSG